MIDIDKIQQRVELRETPGTGEQSTDCVGCGKWYSRCCCDQWLADQVPQLLAEVRSLRQQLKDALAAKETKP